MVGRRVRVLLSALSTVRVAIVGAIVGAVVVVAVPVWGLVAGPSAVSPQLGFTHVPACVVVDTSITGGAFVVPTSPPRDYVVTGNGDFSAQGGSATGCGVPEGVAGVFFNLKTKWVSGKGRVEVYEAGGTATGAPLVNFDESSFKDNAGATTMLCTGICSADFTVSVLSQAAASTHVVVTVLGYFTEANERTIFVNGGGTKEDNGTALTNALAAIPTTGPDIPSDINPWLIKLEPGTFDLGTVSIGLVLPGHVHLEGSGAAATTITCDCTSRAIDVNGGGSVMISDTTITNTESIGVGIDNAFGVSFELSDATVLTAGDAGIRNFGSVTVRDSHIENTGVFSESDGIVNRNGAMLEVVGSTIISGGNEGIVNVGTVTIRDSHIEATGTSSDDNGIENWFGAMLEVVGSTVLAAGGDGVGNFGTLVVRDSHVETIGTGSVSDGIQNGSGELDVVSSTVLSAGRNGIYNEGTVTIRDSDVETTGTGDGILNANAGSVLELAGSSVVAKTGHGIDNVGTVTVRDSRVETVNTATAGMVNVGDVTVDGSVLSGGTGIQNSAGGMLQVSSSRLVATGPAALDNFGGTGTGTARIENSVLESVGDAVYNGEDDVVTITGSTLTAGSAYTGVLNDTVTSVATISNTSITASDEVSNNFGGPLTCYAVTYLTAGSFNATTCP